MARVLITVHLAQVLMLLGLGLGVAVEQREECAELNNTSLQEYRQGHRAQHRVQYLLLTRENPDCPSLFSPDTPITHRQQTPFSCSRPTKIIIHGYRALGSSPSWVTKLARAVLRAEDSNVLVVDWVCGASFGYMQAVDSYKEVALQISGLIKKLQVREEPRPQGCGLESFHLIGVSLGAHVAGFVGTMFEGKIGRITGLDPAGPMFKKTDLFNRLDPSDALFVDVIHTDSDFFGISIPIGHVDFFLNGGRDQVGCTRPRLSLSYGYVICDHMRALYVYISSLNGSCPLTGVPCPSYEDFLQGRCLSCQGPCPTIGVLNNSGVTASPLPREPKIFLLTTPEPPYCAHHVLLEVRVSRLERSAKLEVTLREDSMATKVSFLIKKDSVVTSRVLALSSPLCQLDSIQLRSTTPASTSRDTSMVDSICITPIPASRAGALRVNNFDVRRGDAVVT
ncbi:Phospholipase A1 member A [Merluccius polli]|uniref:Phospholipase A1 member A n=1 Tax=Merluccius polli TaxID=89951 RepID=A0AA47M764_MERPO|nr:Phospholipase A1 member A [Merluccius polli]